MTATLTLLVLAAGVAASAASAPAGDPMQSPRCTRALEALRAHEAQLPASAAQGASSALARAAALRRAAQRECLGGPGAVPPPQMHREPVRVPPVSGAAPVPPGLPLRPAPAPTAAPAPAAPATFVTACDAGGCWTSDGSYLSRVGGSLFGPRGLCSVVGSTVSCP